jgi:membrane protein DedA with SNARE-associated domain
MIDDVLAQWLTPALILYLGFAGLAMIKSGSLAFLAGVAAQQGVVDGLTVGMALIVAGVVSDEIRFGIGRAFGPRLSCRFPRIGRMTIAIQPTFARHAVPLILCYRFLKSVRMVGSFAAGMLGMNRLVFSAANLAGAVIWTVFWIPIGIHASAAIGPEASLIAMAVMMVVLVMVGLAARYANSRMPTAA